jgi:uncharacterized protein YjaZ
MAVKIHVLDAGRRMSAVRGALVRIVGEVAPRVALRLPLPPVDVVVQAQTALTIPEIGVGGYAPSSELAFLYIDPDRPDLAQNIQTHLGAMLAHELFHCARWRGPGYGRTLGEALVSEGLALHFEAQFRPAAPFYAKTLSESQLERLSKRAARGFSSTDYGHQDWFFGSVRRRLPKYAGYGVAFHLVDKALRALDRQPQELWDVPCDVLLRAAGMS